MLLDKFGISFLSKVGATNYARFFPEEQQYAYSCGHLFARGDVNTRVGQAATMFHLNVAPQQGILNAGNWKVWIFLKVILSSLPLSVIYLNITHEDYRKRRQRFPRSQYRLVESVDRYVWFTPVTPWRRTSCRHVLGTRCPRYDPRSQVFRLFIINLL